MATTSCANHICKNSVAGDCYSCSLCNAPKYCSEDCRTVDWVEHGCPNKYTLDKFTANHLVPYFYEDQMPHGDLKQTPMTDPVFASYSVAHYSETNDVREYIVPPLVDVGAIAKSECDGIMMRGRSADGLTPTVFRLEIVVSEQRMDTLPQTPVVVTGKIPTDVVWPGRENSKAHQLAGGGTTAGKRMMNVLKGGVSRAAYEDKGVYVLWPSNQPRQLTNVTMPLKGGVKVSLAIERGDNKEVLSIANVEAVYDFMGKKQSLFQGLTDRTKAFFKRQLQIKFSGTSRTIENMSVCRFVDTLGNGIVITVEVQANAGIARLVDVEFIVPVASLDEHINPKPVEAKASFIHQEIVSSRLQCDVTKLEDVVALGMALDVFVDEGLDDDKKQLLQSYGNTINHYARKMEEDEDVDGQIPDAVRVAAHNALELIGARNDAFNWASETSGKNALGMPYLQQKVKAKLIGPLLALRAQGNKRGNSIKKGYLRRMLNVVLTGLSKRQRMNPSEMVTINLLQQDIMNALRGDV